MSSCKCGRTVQFFESHCECGEFHSFPNVRAAKAELVQLAARYNQARAAAFQRGTNPQIDTVEQLAEAACAAVNLSVRAADNVVKNDKYRNYYQPLPAGI